MPLRVLIVPDKFKGSLTASTAARAIARGWKTARPLDSLELLPISDGGDGFGLAMSRLLAATPVQCRTVDAAHRPCSARWWFVKKSATAIIESARVIGLAMLPPGQFHPFDLDTFGLATVIRAAQRRGAQRCIIGIGGSATNDGGFGLARGLGWHFLDSQGHRLEAWTDLRRLARIVPPDRPSGLKMDLTVAVDVRNPLLGPQGATRVYGPQKGLRPRDLQPAEASLERLAIAVKKSMRKDPSRRAGAGAAGGLGFGLTAFLNAHAESGWELFARLAHLDQRLRNADLVLTGEGAVDASTLMGKGVGEIARRCRQLGIPCIALAGQLAEPKKLSRYFTQANALTPDLVCSEEAHGRAAHWLTQLTKRTAREDRWRS